MGNGLEEEKKHLGPSSLVFARAEIAKWGAGEGPRAQSRRFCGPPEGA